MISIKTLFANKSASRIISLAVSVYTLCCLIFYIVYAAKYDYFDAAALVFCIAAIAAAACYFFFGYEDVRRERLIAVLAVASAVCLSVTFAVILKNSIDVWADELNGIKMFGSRGGLAPVIALIVLFAAAIAAQITACFFNSARKQQVNEQ